MEEFWEVVKGIGAVVGLLTGAFVVWDRSMRHYPFAVVTARPMIPNGMNYHALLFIENPSPRPIILEWKNGAGPGQLRVAVDNSARGIIKSILEGRSTLVLDQKSTVELVLLKPSDYAELPADQTVTYEIGWQYAQPSLYKPKRHLRGGIAKRDLQTLLRENLEGYTQSPTDYEGDDQD
ncbi:hypothetical protein ACFOEZ_04115 [Tianweitania populi]|uniref:Uncharacterized protein n=1 Tax=Tianweitania populi TaxID=1607949 RepID=A0A8J3DU96_9HYPH|nr:hypothetical protein [Tianweitania populi]GHD07694.1 hypothetical protein GCM10016234_06400 [Tianweitania populi]